MSCFREQKKDRKQHGENCYRRALKVVREMSHPSWKPVELNTIHEFARELLGAGMQKQAVKEMHGAMEMLVRSTPTRPCSPAQLDFQDVSDRFAVTAVATVEPTQFLTSTSMLGRTFLSSRASRQTRESTTSP